MIKISLDYFKKYSHTDLKNTNYLYKHLISIPLHCDLSINQQIFVIDNLIKNMKD